MLLNPFEIKAEILNIIDDCKDETDINILQQRVSKLDQQADIQTIGKILFKELLHADTSKEKIIRFLLQRYIEKDRLIEQLWSVLKNTMTSSEVKIIVLSYLRELETDWKYEDFESVVGKDIDIVDNDTKKLLDTAIVNPEVQIDFLDFLASVDNRDRLILVKSLADDYTEDALANILIPVFLSAPDSEIGKEALSLLGNSRSQLAYHALNTAYDYLSDGLKQQVKKNLNILKLAGIREDNSKEFYKKLLSGSKPYRCCLTFPDGLGNQALIFSRKNLKTNKVQFVAIVTNDYSGIRDCFGFNEISEFECDKIIERFYKDEKNIPVTPKVLKTLILYAEKISKEKTLNWLLPYEYVCWKNIMTDIEPEEHNVEDLLSKTFGAPTNVKGQEFEQILQEDFLKYWFLDSKYSSEFEAFIDIANSEAFTPEFDFDKLIDEYTSNIFYNDEQVVWKKRLLICSYIYLSDNSKEFAKTLYNLYYDEKMFQEFLKFILRKSVYEYYFSLKYNTEENQNKFTLKQLDDIINSIEQKWVKNV